MNSTTLSVRGIMPPIPTPFDADGELAIDALHSNIAKWNQTGLLGYVVLGSNGEAALLTDAEKRRALSAAREAIPTGKLLVAGTGCESTRETIALTLAAADIGADAALVITPCFYDPKMNADELLGHYRAVADASPIPIMLYSVPKFTHVDIPAPVVARAAQHPNIIGIKDSGGNITKIGDMVRMVPDGFQVLAGSAGFLFAGLAVGAVGGVVALANIAPNECVQLLELFAAGQMAEAAALQRRLIPLNTAITATYGVPGLKAAMDMLGYYGGPVRAPLLDLPQEQSRALHQVLSQGGLL